MGGGREDVVSTVSRTWQETKMFRQNVTSTHKVETGVLCLHHCDQTAPTEAMDRRKCSQFQGGVSPSLAESHRGGCEHWGSPHVMAD